MGNCKEVTSVQIINGVYCTYTSTYARTVQICRIGRELNSEQPSVRHMPRYAVVNPLRVKLFTT